MQATSIYDAHDSVVATRGHGQTEFLRAAQRAELDQLVTLVPQLQHELGRPLCVFDIGIGNGRIPMLLAVDIVRHRHIRRYVGLDISESELDECRQNVAHYMPEALELVCGDARELPTRTWPEALTRETFDFALCSYFTPGNFRPHEIVTEEDDGKIVLKTGLDGLIAPFDPSCLNPNQAFVAVFKWTWEHLASGGKIVLGTTYIDSETTRQRQEEFYRKCGMLVITDSRYHFAATREAFWSERFTEERFYQYLGACGISSECITFIPLDDYEFARMVVVHKPR